MNNDDGSSSLKSSLDDVIHKTSSCNFEKQIEDLKVDEGQQSVTITNLGSDGSRLESRSASSSDSSQTDHQEVDIEPDIVFDIIHGFNRFSHYVPVLVDYSLECATISDFSHPVNSLGSQLNIPGWDHELAFENDDNLREYLTFGVKNGFLIVDENCDIPTYESPNYASVRTGEAHAFVDKLIRDELSKGKYVISSNKPHCVHGLGAVPKKEKNKWRPITDCKRPIGSSINSFMSDTCHNFCYTDT